jgi:hypothetical protein
MLPCHRHNPFSETISTFGQTLASKERKGTEKPLFFKKQHESLSTVTVQYTHYNFWRIKLLYYTMG